MSPRVGANPLTSICRKIGIANRHELIRLGEPTSRLWQGSEAGAWAERGLIELREGRAEGAPLKKGPGRHPVAVDAIPG